MCPSAALHTYGERSGDFSLITLGVELIKKKNSVSRRFLKSLSNATSLFDILLLAQRLGLLHLRMILGTETYSIVLIYQFDTQRC